MGETISHTVDTDSDIAATRIFATVRCISSPRSTIRARARFLAAARAVDDHVHQRSSHFEGRDLVTPGSTVAAMRRETLHGLSQIMHAEHLAAAKACAGKLYEGLPDRQQLRNNCVLVAYGGGKDSSYTTAFVRCMQLVLAAAHGDTFRLRVVTNRHAAMPSPVMRNIGRVYSALRIFEDPDCEPLLVDHNAIKRFRVDEPLPAELVKRNRDDILLTGHRTNADPRPTFCNACNFSMVSSFGLAASHGDGVDVIITGDSSSEQRAYYVWVTRLAQKYGIHDQRTKGDFGGFLGTMRNLSRLYFSDLHGSEATEQITSRLVASQLKKSLKFFSIYTDTDYASGQHWDLLTKHLGFQFDDVAFSFSESDCANPALMAHLRGLKCERLYERSYAEGIAEYVSFGVGLMRKKEFPQTLIDIMTARYDGDANVQRMRAAVDRLTVELYGLTEQQLVCMIFSPFASRGKNLEAYLQKEQASLVSRIADIRRLLDSPLLPQPGSGDHALAETLENLTGLELQQLRVIFSSVLHATAGGDPDRHLITDILARDPHKEKITTQHAPGGPLVGELISGR